MIRTAIGIALRPAYIFPATLSDDEKRILIEQKDRIQKSLLAKDEKDLIQRHGLVYERHSENIHSQAIYLRRASGQAAYVPAENAMYWYRAMDWGEFSKLKSKQQFVATDSYGGIASCRDYSAKYVGKASTDVVMVIVEWTIPPGGRLYELMREAGINPKGESGASSYGLGETGTNANQGKDAAFKIFDHYCGATFRVVDLRIPFRVEQLLA